MSLRRAAGGLALVSAFPVASVAMLLGAACAASPARHAPPEPTAPAQGPPRADAGAPASSATPPEPPWVASCAALLGAAGAGDGLPAWVRRGGLVVGATGVAWLAAEGSRQLRVEVEAGDFGDPSRWYPVEESRPGASNRRSREYNGLAARITATVPPGETDPAGPFEHAAEACLALAGMPAPKLDADDGTVMLAPGLHLIDRGDHALLVSEYFDAELWSPTSDSPSIRPGRSLVPDDLPRGVLPDEQISSISCGDGDWLLVLSQGWGFSPDGASLPRARYWRHGASGWAGAESHTALVAGCGPGWTLVASAEMSAGAAATWAFQVSGAAGMRPPRLEAGRVAGCPHRLVMTDVVAFPSGDVFAVGTECAGNGATKAAAAQRWHLGTEGGRFEHLPAPAGSGLQSVSGADPRHVEASFFSGDASHRVVFDGHRWTAAPAPGPSQGWEQDAPDGGKLTADIPSPRDARAALASVQESFIAPSGDLWAVLDFDKHDCGRCFRYRALVRVRADRFRARR